jgi:ABC-type antimicrobial peptide transport system permease subunit
MNYLVRMLKRYNGIILLNIIGLAMGLVGVIFISLWVGHELSYDRFHKDANRIYRVESLLDFTGQPFVWTVAPAPVGQNIMKDFPEVESVVMMKETYMPVIRKDNEIMEAENLYYSTENFFSFFSYELHRGDSRNVLRDPFSIVLSESVAKRIFGNDDPLGETLLFNNKQLLTVTGIMADPPSNTHLKADYVLPFSLLDAKTERLDKWGTFNFPIYIKLRDGVSAEEFNNKLMAYLKTKDEGSKAQLFINPLTRLYLHKNPGFESMIYPSGDRGPITRVILFSVIGVVLLLIASMNFVNLSTAMGAERSREIGVRKASGAGRKQIIMQLFGESFVQCIISLILALAIIISLLPVFTRITGIEFNLNSLLEPGKIIMILIITIITALLAGAYPAVVLSSFKPAKVLKSGNGNGTSGLALRKVLVITQFVLSILFIFSILVMNRQISYMQSTNLGFDKDQVMVIYPEAGSSKVDIMAEEISAIPGVSDVATGTNVPVNMGNWQTLGKWDGNTANKKLKFHMMQVDDNYLDLLGMEIVEGRQLLEGTARAEVILNEAAVSMMEMSDPIGKSIWRNDTPFEIVGLVKDFHFRKLKDEVQPVFIFKQDDWWAKRIFVKLEPGNNFRLTDRIAAVVSKHEPNYPVRYIFLDEEVERYYEEERRLSRLINISTVMSIIISAIGLFSLTAFAARKKSKEIGIRKAHGASSSGLLLMLQKQFGSLVIISSLIALPLAYYIINRWLESYAYHIKINPAYFIITFFSIALIASLTILFHTLRTARLNPADTLRDE